MSPTLKGPISDETAESAGSVFACIDSTEASLKVVPVARTLARALGTTVTLLHAIDQTDAAHAPLDPVEWEIARREAQDYVTDTAARFGTAEDGVETRVVEGARAEQFCACGSAPSDIIAICNDKQGAAGKLDAFTRQLLENSTASFLLVPAVYPSDAEAHFRRVVVPLDGSAQAEAALPYAMRIAASEKAELALVHATPEPVLTRIGPLTKSDDELVRKTRERNERVAKEYLGRVEARLASELDDVSHQVLSGGDVRRLLATETMLSATDLVVIASHGQSGYADVPHGDVASFLLERSKAPVLMIRHGQAIEHAHVHVRARSKGARRPGGPRR